MVKKIIYKSIIDNIVELLDVDINYLLEPHNRKRMIDYLVPHGDRNEYTNIIKIHFLPLIKIAQLLRWNNTYIYLKNTFDKFYNEFTIDSDYINKHVDNHDDNDRFILASRRKSFRDYLKFHFKEGLLKHLKEDSKIIAEDIYKDEVLYNKNAVLGDNSIVLLSDIKRILDLTETTADFLFNARENLISSLGDNKIDIDNISEEILNMKDSVISTSVFSYAIKYLLFTETLDGAYIKKYETQPGK